MQSLIQRSADNLGINPDHLARIMNFESGLDPSRKNKKSGASGLIQFMPFHFTKKEDGTDNPRGWIPGKPSEFRQKSAAEQMPYVEKYLRNAGVQGRQSFDDLYAAVLYPKAIGKPGDSTLFAKGSKEYAQNDGLDKNKDGRVTKVEAASRAYGGEIPQFDPIAPDPREIKARGEYNNLQQVIRAKEGKGEDASKERRQLYVLQNFLKAKGETRNEQNLRLGMDIGRISTVKTLKAIDAAEAERKQAPKPKTLADLEATLPFTREELAKAANQGQSGDFPVVTKGGQTIPFIDAINLYRQRTGRDFSGGMTPSYGDDSELFRSNYGRIANPEETMRRNGGRPQEPSIVDKVRKYGYDYAMKGNLFPAATVGRAINPSFTKEDLDAIEGSAGGRIAREAVRLPQSVLSGAADTIAGLPKFSNMLAGIGGKQGDALSALADGLRDPKTEAGINVPYAGNVTLQDVASTGGSALASFAPGMAASRALAPVSRVAPSVGKWLGAGVSSGIEGLSIAGSDYDQAVKSGVDRNVARNRALSVLPGNLATGLLFNRLGEFGDAGGALRRAGASVLAEGGEEASQQIGSNYVTKGKFDTEGVAKSALLGGLIGGGMGAFTATQESPKIKARLLTDSARKALEKSSYAQNPMVQRLLQADAARVPSKPNNRAATQSVSNQSTVDARAQSQVQQVVAATQAQNAIQQANQAQAQQAFVQGQQAGVATPLAPPNATPAVPPEAQNVPQWAMGAIGKYAQPQDDLYAKASAMFAGDPTVSTPKIQRAFGIGYGPSSEILQRMRSEGVVPHTVLRNDAASTAPQPSNNGENQIASLPVPGPTLAPAAGSSTQATAQPLRGADGGAALSAAGIEASTTAGQVGSTAPILGSSPIAGADPQADVGSGPLGETGAGNLVSGTAGNLPGGELSPGVGGVGLTGQDGSGLDVRSSSEEIDDLVNEIKQDAPPAQDAIKEVESAQFEEPRRGRQAIVDRLDMAFRDEGLFNGDRNQFTLAKDVVNAMPDSVLDKIGLATFSPKNPNVKGAYLGDRDIALIARNLQSSEPAGAAYTVAHEISHPLEAYIGDDKAKLVQQFERELKSDWFKVAGKLSSYPGLKNLSVEEILANEDAKADAFSEWLADTFARKGIRNAERSVQPILRRVIEQAKDFIQGLIDFYSRKGMKDHAERVYRTILLGESESRQDFVRKTRLQIEEGGIEAVWDKLQKLSTLLYRRANTQAQPTVKDFTKEIEGYFGAGYLSEDQIRALYQHAKTTAESDGKGLRYESTQIAEKVEGYNPTIDVTGLPAAKNAFSSPLLNEMGFDPTKGIDGTTVTWGEEEEKARQKMADHAVTPDLPTYADKVERTIQAMEDPVVSASDQIAIVLGVEDLISQRRARAKDVKELLSKDTTEDEKILIRTHQAAIADIEAKIEKYLVALQKTGSALGRALNARKAILDETFIDPIQFEAEAAAKAGRNITEEERKELEDLSAEVEKARARMSFVLTIDKLKREKARLDKKLKKLKGEVGPDQVAEAERRLQAAKDQIDALKKQLSALRRTDRAAQKEEDRLRGLLDQKEAEKDRLSRYVDRLKKNPNYAGPGIDLFDLYEKELKRIVLEMATAKTPERIRELSKQAQDLRRELSKGREYLDDVLTGRKTPAEVLAPKGEGKDGSQIAITDPMLKPLREKFDEAAAEMSIFASLINQSSSRIESLKARIEEQRRQIETGNFTGPDRITDQDYAQKTSEIRGRMESDPRLQKLREMEAELAELEKTSRKRRDLSKDLQDIVSRLDLGTLIQAPATEKAYDDPSIKALQDELKRARAAAKGFLDAMEPQGFIDMVRNVTQSMLNANIAARIGDGVAGAVVAFTERGPVKTGAQIVERALFPRETARKGSATGGVISELLDGFSPARAMSNAVTRAHRNLTRVYSKQTVSDIVRSVKIGDGAYAEKYGDPRGLRSAANTTDPKKQARRRKIDKFVNQMGRTVSITDTVYQKMFREGVISDMVDAMVSHMAKEARKAKKPFNPAKTRELILKNENGELDRIAAVADLEARTRVFAEGSGISEALAKAFGNLSSASMWANTFKPGLEATGMKPEQAKRLAQSSGDAMAFAFAVLVTRYPKIFFRIADYGLDFAVGGVKAGARVASRKMVGANLTEADRRAVSYMVSRNLIGMALMFLASKIDDEDEKKIGRYDESLKSVEYPGIGIWPARVQVDQIGGPFSVILTALSIRKLNRLRKEGIITEDAHRSAIDKTLWNSAANQPAITGSKQFLETVTGEEQNLSKRFAQAMWQAAGLGGLSNMARDLDEQKTGVTRRFGATPDDPFIEGVLKELETRIPVTREETPRSKAGVVYRSMPQDLQEEFRKLNYSPDEVKPNPERGVTEELAKAAKGLREDLVIQYAKNTVNDPRFKSLPDENKDEPSEGKRGMLSKSVQSAINVAHVATRLGLSRDQIQILAKHKASLPNLLPQQGNETPEMRKARLKSVGDALQKAIPKIDESLASMGVIKFTPQERKEAVDFALSEVVTIASIPSRVEARIAERMSSEYMKAKEGKYRQKVFAAALISASQR